MHLLFCLCVTSIEFVLNCPEKVKTIIQKDTGLDAHKVDILSSFTNNIKYKMVDFNKQKLWQWTNTLRSTLRDIPHYPLILLLNYMLFLVFSVLWNIKMLTNQKRDSPCSNTSKRLFIILLGIMMGFPQLNYSIDRYFGSIPINIEYKICENFWEQIVGR